MMNFLQFLVPLGQHGYLTLKIPHLVQHHSLFSLEVDLLLEQFFIVNQILFDVDAAAVIEGRFPLLQQVLIDLQAD